MNFPESTGKMDSVGEWFVALTLLVNVVQFKWGGMIILTSPLKFFKAFPCSSIKSESSAGTHRTKVEQRATNKTRNNKFLISSAISVQNENNVVKVWYVLNVFKGRIFQKTISGESLCKFSKFSTKSHKEISLPSHKRSYSWIIYLKIYPLCC